jgi:hypothetical protein
MKTITIILSIIPFIYFGNIGLDLNEVEECINWKQQASKQSNFYLLKWQKMQCDAHNITIINE